MKNVFHLILILPIYGPLRLARDSIRRCCFFLSFWTPPRGTFAPRCFPRHIFVFYIIFLYAIFSYFSYSEYPRSFELVFTMIGDRVRLHTKCIETGSSLGKSRTYYPLYVSPKVSRATGRKAQDSISPSLLFSPVFSSLSRLAKARIIQSQYSHESDQSPSSLESLFLFFSPYFHFLFKPFLYVVKFFTHLFRTLVMLEIFFCSNYFLLHLNYGLLFYSCTLPKTNARNFRAYTPSTTNFCCPMGHRYPTNLSATKFLLRNQDLYF